MEKFITCLFLLFLAVSSSFAAENENWRRYEELLVKSATDPEFTVLWQEHIKKFEAKEEQAFPAHEKQEAFPCNSFSAGPVPNSVHQLTPADIKVVAAMGDSITAGNGINANTPVGVLSEDRGHSWSIGGVENYENVITLPNILKQYNSAITGFSTGTGNRGSGVSRLNVAFPGNVASHMPEQAIMLVDRIRAMSDVNFQDDWKLVTLFIGGNDLCYYCADQNEYSPDKYRDYIMEALDTLQRDLPRTFVNLVSIFDLSVVPELPDTEICTLVHRAICDCPRTAPDATKDAAVQYSSLVENLINSGRYEGSNDFTVVFQPFMRDNDLPRLGNGDPDRSYFSPDCFHFSLKGHESITKMLWNGMFDPVGSKKTESSFTLNLYCPPSGTFLPTAQNSRMPADMLEPYKALVHMNAETPESSSPPSNTLPIILGVTGCVCGLVALALVAVVIHKKKQRPLEDLTHLAY